MGIVHARRGTHLVPAIILTVLAALAVVTVLAFTAGPASAKAGWTHSAAASCSSCHTGSPPSAANATVACQTCHSGGFVAHPKAGAATTCWTCHTPGQSMTTIQTAAGCGAAASGAGCHGATAHKGSTLTTCTTCHGQSTGAAAPGQSAHHKTSVTDVTVKPVLTAKLSATSIRLGKTFKATGLAKPVSATYKVTALIQKKVGTKWVKVTSKTAVPNATSYAWTVTYKPTKKATYRVIATTPAVPSTTTVGVTAVLKGSKTTKTCIVK